MGEGERGRRGAVGVGEGDTMAGLGSGVGGVEKENNDLQSSLYF